MNSKWLDNRIKFHGMRLKSKSSNEMELDSASTNGI